MVSVCFYFVDFRRLFLRLIGGSGDGFELDVEVFQKMHVWILVVSDSVILILRSFFLQKSGKKVRIFKKS